MNKRLLFFIGCFVFGITATSLLNILKQPTEINSDRKESYRQCASNLQNEKEDNKLCNIQPNKCIEANQGQSVKERVEKSGIQGR